MNNPRKILETLDGHLQGEARLILYGRAALVLGYEQAPLEFGATMDVDAILPLVEMSQIEANDDFWDAVDATNRELEPTGLYITHLFSDDQVILSPEWLVDIQPIKLPLSRLQLFRPSTHDLILTKMMRVDPQDRSDILFLLRQKDVDVSVLKNIFHVAKIPQIPEIHEAYQANLKWLEAELQESVDSSQ